MYVDDAFIKSRSFAEHLKHLLLFWSAIRKFGLTLKLRKTLFCRKEIPFLGFILTREGVKPDHARVQAIKEIPEPRTREELQKFIGMCTYYRRFYKEYARYLEPFRELMSSSQKFKWQDKHHIAFNMLRNKLSDHVLLNHYRRDRPFCLQTDGSKTGISAILFQYDDDGNELVIALISR